MSNDDSGTFVLVIFVCCAVSCIVALLVWMNGGTLGSIFSASAIADALANFKFITPTAINVGGGTTSTTNPFSFNKYTDFTVPSAGAMGSAVPGKTLDQCNSLCGSTPNCVGFSNDNNGCQLFNNVNILERKKGSTIYASGDIGAVQYLHVPYKNITLPMAPQLWSKTGGIGDFVSNCQTSHTVCKGFSVSGSDALMYPAIVGVDSSQTGDTYIDPNKPPQFILEGNYTYSETPDKTWSLPASYLLSDSQVTQYSTQQTQDSEWFVYFDGKGTGFDAGLDHTDAPPMGRGQLSNVITVTGLSQCQNACVANSWCQSFTMIGTTQCYQRHDFIPQHFLEAQPNGQPCPYDSSICHCGYDWAGAQCLAYNPARDGTNGTGNTSYVKKQYPLSISCPQTCSNDGSCVMVTYDTQGHCSQYNTPPTNRTPLSSNTSVWTFDNFPR